MKYGKLVNGSIRYAPKKIEWTDENEKLHIVNNPKPEKLEELGYKKIIETECPTDAPEGQHYEYGVPEETETEIIQTWHLVDDPVYPEPEPTMSDLVEAVERGINS